MQELCALVVEGCIPRAYRIHVPYIPFKIISRISSFALFSVANTDYFKPRIYNINNNDT